MIRLIKYLAFSLLSFILQIYETIIKSPRIIDKFCNYSVKMVLEADFKPPHDAEILTFPA